MYLSLLKEGQGTIQTTTNFSSVSLSSNYLEGKIIKTFSYFTSIFSDQKAISSRFEWCVGSSKCILEPSFSLFLSHKTIKRAHLILQIGRVLSTIKQQFMEQLIFSATTSTYPCTAHYYTNCFQHYGSKQSKNVQV